MVSNQSSFLNMYLLITLSFFLSLCSFSKCSPIVADSKNLSIPALFPEAPTASTVVLDGRIEARSVEIWV